MSSTADPASKFFDIVMKEVDRSQVELQMTSLGYGHVWIDLIQVHDGLEGRGIGSSTLRRLVEIADSMAITIKLKAITVKPWQLGQNQLERFYERHGFVTVRRDKFSNAPTMERMPACMLMAA